MRIKWAWALLALLPSLNLASARGNDGGFPLRDHTETQFPPLTLVVNEYLDSQENDSEVSCDGRNLSVDAVMHVDEGTIPVREVCWDVNQAKFFVDHEGKKYSVSIENRQLIESKDVYFEMKELSQE